MSSHSESSPIPVEHRTWPTPNRRPWMRMSWHDLLFIHWPVCKNDLQHLIPTRLEIDTFEGQAWVGVVPFRMSGVMRYGLPDLPGVSAFPELNVRTYVTFDGKPGVWFFSLDAQNWLAVRVARWLFNLPYMDAMISIDRNGDRIDYRSHRVHKGEKPADLDVNYKPVSDAFETHSGSLEHWLTARYCLYSADPRKRLFRGEIAHRPWSLQQAECEIRHCSMLEWLELKPATDSPLLHYADRLDVLAWSNDRLT